MRSVRTARAAVIAMAVLLGGGAARAEVAPAELESAKHLTMVELYLRGARDAAKALQVVATMGATGADPALLGEVEERAVDQVTKAEIHLRQLKKLGASAGRIDFHVKKARIAVDQLSAFKPRDHRLTPREIENLRVAAEHINAHVSDALRRVDGLADEIGHASMDDIDVRERVPVKGKR